MSETTPLAAAFERDGFVFPYDVVDVATAQSILADLEAGEAELAERPEDLALLRSYPDQLLPSFAELVRLPRMLEAASQILGPDLMVWSSGLFIKEANTPSYVSWHQDLTYWGLDDTCEVTIWVALSPANLDSGCMRYIPGSHKQRIVPHADSFAQDNLLTRGQEIAVRVDEDRAVDVILEPGQATIHHGHLFHASGPNRTAQRRVGAAIRYISPAMRQRSGDKVLVALVSGEDRYGHFKVAEAPERRLEAADLELCRADSKLKRQILFAGAEDRAGKRYA